MVEWIVSSSVLIAAVILLRFVLKGKISLRLQYALWALVLVRLLVPVSFGSSGISIMNTALEVPVVQDAVVLSGIGEIELSNRGTVIGFPSGAIMPDTPVTIAEGKSEADFSRMKTVLSARDIFTAVWGIGSAIMLLVFAVTNADFRRRLTQNRKAFPNVQCALPVYISESVETPCLFGLFHPAIYLTMEAAESEHTIHHAVEHELTHFHHKDNIWAILRSVCLAIHWYNPLVWCAAVLSRNDAELACDESTILRLGEEERASYGRTLIHLTCEKRPALLNTATTMTGSGKSIKERIALIVKKPKMALYTMIAVLVITAVAVGCTFTGAKESDTPWNWAQALTSEEITSVTLWGDNGNVTLTDEESADLVRLLNTLEKRDFTENDQLTGGTPTYGLTVQTANGEYNINESIAPAGSLEINYKDKQWWIDDDDLEKFIREIPTEGNFHANIAVALGSDIPQAVIDYATDFVQQQIDYHNELGNNPPENMGEYSITDAKITVLEQISTGTAGLNDGVALYRLEYRLLADHPENIIMASGMSVESGWLTEYGSTGQPYLLLHYDDSGIETIWPPLCVTNTDMIEVDYGTPEMLAKYGNAYTAAAMELWEDYQNSNEMERWESEHKLYGFTVQANGSYAEIGQQWAEAFVSQYVDVLSDDHPLKSTNCAVLNCDFFAESLETAPKKLIFNMRFACLAEDQNKFEQWYAGWAGPMADEQYPQYAGWMEFGNFVVLEQTEPGLWTCTDAGTGGYGGWGWLNFEEAGEVGFRMEQLLSGEDDIMAELLLRVLPFINWSDFDSEWGPEGWSTLWQLLERSCISQGQVYGPEETRMWSDVYPDDQLYRNLYIMLAIQNSDGAYTEGLVEILHKQREYDPELFDACLQQLTDTQQKVIKAVMSL